MANFYLCRVWVFRKVVGGIPVDEGMRVGTEATLRYVMDDYQTTKHGGSTVTVGFPREKYSGVRMSVRFGDGDRRAVPPVLPTVALMRVEGTLEVGDYNIDMTTKNATQWQTMYDTYPLLAATPYADAPFQPIG